MVNRMDDLISRQAAIELWEEYHPYIAVKACEYGKRLRSLPSAERQGRWKWNNEEEFFYSCSNCGHKAYGNTVEIISGLYNYCPNCGARMAGVLENG